MAVVSSVAAAVARLKRRKNADSTRHTIANNRTFPFDGIHRPPDIPHSVHQSFLGLGAQHLPPSNESVLD